MRSILAFFIYVTATPLIEVIKYIVRHIANRIEYRPGASAFIYR